MRTKKQLTKLIIIILLLAASSAGLINLPSTDESAKKLREHNPGLYQIDHVADGDTIVVKNNDGTEKVRLVGVDTPEKNDTRKPIQCFAHAASEFTTKKLAGQEVRLETDPQGDTRDRYGRLLRYVYLTDGTLLNKAIIEEGYGFAMTGFPFTKMEEFRAAQRTAREQNRGLWATCSIDEARGYPQTNAAP